MKDTINFIIVIFVLVPMLLISNIIESVEKKYGLLEK